MSDKRQDITQIGLTDKANEQLEDIYKITQYFEHRMHIYKFAVSVALAKNMVNEKYQYNKLPKTTIKYGVSSVDPDGSMKKIISIISPNHISDSYMYSEKLAVAGINFMHSELVEKNKPIIDLIEDIT